MIIFHGVVLGILLVVIAFFLFKLMVVNKKLDLSTEANHKAVILLRDEREKTEKLLKQLKEKEE
jgi:cell division protein FtsB